MIMQEKAFSVEFKILKQLQVDNIEHIHFFRLFLSSIYF